MPRSAGGILKRSLAIAGHRTSVSLEAPFWEALAAIAVERGCSVPKLVAALDADRGDSNLSSAIRVFVLADALARAAARTQPPAGAAPP